MSKDTLLDDILEEFREEIHEALQKGHTRTHYTLARLRVHRRLRRNWPEQEVEDNLHLVIELLDQIRKEVQEELGQAATSPTIDWKAVGQEALAVAENMGWSIEIRFNPSQKTLFLKTDVRQMPEIEEQLPAFREKIHRRLPEKVFQEINFRPVEDRRATRRNSEANPQPPAEQPGRRTS